MLEFRVLGPLEVADHGPLPTRGGRSPTVARTWTGSGTNPNATDCSWEVGDGLIGNTIVGGKDNLAQGLNAVGGGGEYNQSSARFSSVLGGCDNKAGGVAGAAPDCGSQDAQAVLGGYDNFASGFLSVVAGGENNQALGRGSSMLGGNFREVDAAHTDYSQAGATSFAP